MQLTDWQVGLMGFLVLFAPQHSSSGSLTDRPQLDVLHANFSRYLCNTINTSLREVKIVISLFSVDDFFFFLHFQINYYIWHLFKGFELKAMLNE